MVPILEPRCELGKTNSYPCLWVRASAVSHCQSSSSLHQEKLADGSPGQTWGSWWIPRPCPVSLQPGWDMLSASCPHAFSPVVKVTAQEQSLSVLAF